MRASTLIRRNVSKQRPFASRDRAVIRATTSSRNRSPVAASRCCRNGTRLGWSIHPIIASTALSDAQAYAKDLVFFALVERGFWLARRGMLTVSIPVTDTMCDDLVAAFTDVLETHAEAFAAIG